MDSSTNPLAISSTFKNSSTRVFWTEWIKLISTFISGRAGIDTTRLASFPYMHIHGLVPQYRPIPATSSTKSMIIAFDLSIFNKKGAEADGGCPPVPLPLEWYLYQLLCFFSYSLKNFSAPAFILIGIPLVAPSLVIALAAAWAAWMRSRWVNSDLVI